VGFDDVTLGDLIEPAITVVAQDPREIGLQAAGLLFERLDGYDGPSRRVVVPTRIIHRGSGELPGPGSR
jgi:LacI family transcriptional regulator